MKETETLASDIIEHTRYVSNEFLSVTLGNVNYYSNNIKSEL